MSLSNGLTEEATVAEWLHHNDLERVFCFLNPPDKKEVYRAYLVTEDATEDAIAQFSLEYRDFESVPAAVLEQYYVSQLPKHLTRDDASPQLDIHVVISIASGTRRAYQFFHLVLRQVLAALGLPTTAYQIHHTTSPQSVTEYTEQVIFAAANAGLRQTVILLSGDGGIFDIINVMLQRPHDAQYVKPVVGLLPLGTGNALANSSGLNRDNTRGFLSFMKGSPHPVPVFAARFSAGSTFIVDEGRATEPIPADNAYGGDGDGALVVYGGMVCSWGLHASLVADSDTEAYRRFGSERFTMAAKALLHPDDGSEPHRYRGRISTLQKGRATGPFFMPLKPAGGDQAAADEHAYVLATMVSKLEKTLTISPASQPLDGQLRLLHWGPVSAEETMRILGQAFDGGKHATDPNVLYREIEGLRIDMDEEHEQWRRICVDGKIVKVGKDGWVEVRTEYRRCIDLVA